MKNVLYIAALILLGCTKDEIIDSPTTDSSTTPVKTEPTLTMGHLEKKINNFQAGQRIQIEANIGNTTEVNPDIVYYLKPIGKNEDLHQIKGIDFNLEEKSKTNQDFQKVDSIALPKGKSAISLKILKPGSFQLKFAIQKYDTKNKKPLDTPIASNLLIFNAVHFYASIQNVDLGKKSYNFWESHTRIRRHYHFSFDDGERKFDTQFSEPVKFDVVYKGNGYSNTTRAGEASYFFPDHENWIMDMPAEQNNFTLRITQKLANGETNIIDYGTIYF